MKASKRLQTFHPGPALLVAMPSCRLVTQGCRLQAQHKWQLKIAPNLVLGTGEEGCFAKRS